MSLTKVSYSMITGAPVNVLDFGAVGYSTRAEALAGVDSTAAITAALATGRPVVFPEGFFAHTGGFVVGLQQHITGAGYKSVVTSTRGTTLVKKSGTSIVFDCNNSDCVISNLSFDANFLDGNQIRLDGCKYGTFIRLSFFNQGSASYSLESVPYDAVLHTAFTNLCVFDQLLFTGLTSGGHMKFGGNILYTTVSNCVIGDASSASAYGIDISDPNALAVQSVFSFVDNFCDGAIRLGGVSGSSNTANIRFNGLSQEPATDRIPFQISARNVVVDQYRINWSDSYLSHPYIKVLNCTDVLINNAIFGDSWPGGGARRAFINFDGVTNCSVKNSLAFSIAAFDFILMDGTTSQGITIQDCNNLVGTNSRHVCKAEGLTIIGGDVDVIFVVGNIDCTNVNSTGSFTLANVNDYRDVANLSTKSKTFTGTLTGCTTAPTNPITYQKVGNVMTLSVPSFTATSNNASVTITGMTPAILFPPANSYGLCVVSNNGGANAIANFIIDATGVINLYTNLSSAGWTNGVMTVLPFTATYVIVST